jgi:hypothetical protein
VLAIVLTFGFSVLGWLGSRIYQEMPPIPDRIVTSDGQVVAPDGAIGRGQAVWQTMGGMEVGSIWGHGSYVAPDWSADWLHRECELILDDWARSEHGRPYADLGAEPQAALRERLRLTLRANRYDPATGTLTIEPVRARLRGKPIALRRGVPRGPARIRDPARDGQRSRTAAAGSRHSGLSSFPVAHRNAGRAGAAGLSGLWSLCLARCRVYTDPACTAGEGPVCGWWWSCSGP